MLKNYFLVAWRHLLRYKLHTAINVIGLAIGISACLAIFQIAKYETSFDTFHPDGEQIYRVYSQFSGVFEGFNSGVTAGLAKDIQESATGVEIVAPFHTMYDPKAEVKSANGEWNVFPKQKTVAIMSPEYFQLFSSYQWLSGSPETSLTTPSKVVLTESKAKLYFGTAEESEVIGKEIRYRDSLYTTVSGIVKDFEEPSDLSFTDFISFSTIENSWLKNDINLDDWGSTNSSSQLFIKKEASADVARIEVQMKTMADLHETEDSDPNWITEYKLQPLANLHYNAELGIFDSSRAIAHLPTLYALMAVAGILLLIASINFINLMTAQALQRGREVGVRKVLGSTRGNLIYQFLGETLVVTTLAVVLSIGLTELSLYYFKEFLPEGLNFTVFEPATLLFMLGMIVVVSLLSGSYPAFVLSSFLPVLALKNQTANNRGSNSTNWIRKSLIVVQFSVSLVLIAGTLIIGRQIDYLLNTDMGFKKDAIVWFYTPWQRTEQEREVLKNELSKIPEIEMISRHQSPPAAQGYSTSIYEFEHNGEINEYNIHGKYGDENFLKLYDIQLIAGRGLMPSDSTKEFVINETLAKKLGFQAPEDALNKELMLSDRPYPIVGVVKDFNVQSLHEPIQPVVMAMSRSNHCFSLKLATEGTKAADFNKTIAKVEEAYKEVFTDAEFNYRFFDESIARFYQTEQRTAKLAKMAMGIAIFISCIGLFGLVSFSIVKRTKEIGVRKVLGASVPNIVALLSKDFLMLVGIAIVIGTPVAWILASKWLEDFAFHIQLQWWMFAIAGVLAIAVAFLTVSFQSVKAALTNPVDALRSE